ncbi:MAG: hypothetical protein FJ291_26825 [Planctomycetes bacterium]|nr:hypothetical protein [Planctomycetota bacterium]
MRQCGRCGKAVELDASCAGRAARCTFCWAMLPPETGEVVAEMEYRERRRPWVKAAGWTLSLALHCLLLVGMTGATWLSGLGTGGGEAEVGVGTEDWPEVSVAAAPPIDLQPPDPMPELPVETPKVQDVPERAAEEPAAEVVPLALNPVGEGVPGAVDLTDLAVEGGRAIPSAAAGAGAPMPRASSGDFKGLLRNRKGASKQAALLRFGGKGTLTAVDKGLAWLARNQQPEGGWNNGVGTSGLALLAFLGAGHTTREGAHKATVQKGFQWLIAQGSRDGDRLVYTRERMYDQGIAAFALCEECAMSQNPEIRAAAIGAIAEVLAAQYPDGGWRYQHRGNGGDTSVTGWQIMALKAAKDADIRIPASAFENATRFLMKVKSEGGPAQRGRANDEPTASFGYTGPGSSWNLTGVGLVSLQFMRSRDDALMRKAANFLLQTPPQMGQRPPDLYGLYYGTIGIFQMGGDYWKKWNEPMKVGLMATQHADGHWDLYSGDALSTALAVLTLEVYYRYAPIKPQ